MNKPKNKKQDAKSIFRKCGTCSQTFAHLLNHDFNHPNEIEERALDPLAGGIMNMGYQCGMIWGATLAVGSESFNRYKKTNEAKAVSILATQKLIESFSKRTKTVNCKEITGYDFSNVFGLMKFTLATMIKGINNSPCFNLAEQWAPEAIQSAREGLSQKQINFNQNLKSCSSELVKKMGASEEETIMVAGFAGGLGLSGNACGALSATIWKKSLDWCRENPGKTLPVLKNPFKKELLKVFFKETNSEIQCNKISGCEFKTVDEHSEYIQNGGCEKLIIALSQT